MTLYRPGVQEKRKLPQKIAMTSVVLVSVSVIVLILLIGLKRPASSTQDGSIEFAQVEQGFIPGQNTSINLSNVIIHVPRDATNLVGSFSAIKYESNQISAEDGADWHRPLIVNIKYLDGAGVPYPDMQFSAPLQICFKLSLEQWFDYNQRPMDYLVQYYAEDQNPPQWENLFIAKRPEPFQLCGSIEHLSLFALAIWAGEEIPVTGLDPYEP
jgi:hypothetical protein